LPVHLFATVGRVGESPVVGPSTWLPERDLIAVISRVSTYGLPDCYELEVWGEPIARYGTLNGARHGAEVHLGEPLRWEQVSATRHEAWSHRLV
jgi:hypothetical protein